MRKKFKILALSMVSGFSVLAFATSSIAWFASGIHVTFGTDASNVNVFGGSDASYYKSGSGTEQDPYVIGNKIHLYNLAWLQYIGYYNKRSTVATGSAIDLEQCYFVLDEDIDMGGLTIPPIGTNKYPFLGNFDGQGYTISNFTISNDDPDPDNSDFGVAKPGNRYQGEQPDIVGFFGVMGKLPNQTIDETYDPTIVGASNVVLENFKVVSKTSQVLIGLAGGYVNGDMSGVKVGDNAKIDVNGQASTAKTNITSNLSDYGLVGYSTRLDNSGGTYSQELSKMDANYDTSQPEGEGQGNQWGGSIDMLALNKRIRYFLNEKSKTGLSAGTYGNATAITYNKSIYTTSSSNVFRYYVDDYQSYSTYSGSTYNNDPASNQIIYRFVGGASNARATTSNPSSTSGTYFYDIPASYVPLLTQDEAHGYQVAEGNTGYFAGDLMHGSNTLRTASYSNTYIGSSYANSELEVLSNSTVAYNANNYKKIDNGHTNNLLSNYAADISADTYPGYSSAYEKVCNVLSSSTFVQGLHFTGNTISSSSTTTIPKAYINGELINNYKTLRSSVDFYAKENGSIKFFAGSYYNTVGTNADSFFSLHTVTRSGSTVTPTQIYSIYENTNAATKKNYPHLYYDSSNNLIDAGYGNNVTKGNMEFDMNWLHNAPPVANAVYYFEIPVNAGEFALGSVAANKTKGAYLMYLDIGANGALKDHVDAHYITTNRSGVAHPIGVDFNVNGSGDNGGDSFGFAIASSNRGTVLVAISTTTNENDTVAVTQSSAIATYSYRKANYTNNFTISGMSGNPPSGNTERVRVLTINLKTTGSVRYNIVITETLGANDVVTEAVYSVNDEISASYDTDAEIEALSNEIIDIDVFRTLPVAATLTRSYGTAEFYTEYNIAKCTDTVVDVTIALNSTRITAAITNGYTLKVNDATISNGQIITQ